MERLIKAAIVLFLAAPQGLQAAELKLGTCETSVGAWDFVTEAGGRAVVAKEGPKYHVLWVARVASGSTGAIEAVGAAGECTCESGPAKLTWKCRIAFSLRPNEAGTEETYEWAVDGDSLRSRLVQPDGTRSNGVAFRRPK